MIYKMNNKERVELYKNTITDIKKLSKPKVDYSMYEKTLGKKKGIGSGKTYQDLLKGFFKSEKKENYIRRNKKSILKLGIDEQEKLYKIFLQYI